MNPWPGSNVDALPGAPPMDALQQQIHQQGGMHSLVLAILDTELAIKEGLKDETEGRWEIEQLLHMAQNPADVHAAIAANPPGHQ